MVDLKEHAEMYQSGLRLKRGRPIRLKDIISWKKRRMNEELTLEKSIELAFEESVEPITYKAAWIFEVIQTHEKINDHENEIIINNMFAFLIAHKIMHNDYESQSIT